MATSRSVTNWAVGCCCVMLLVTLGVFILTLRGCVEKVTPPSRDVTDSLKTVIKGLYVTQDSLKSVTATKDSVRTRYVYKWREIKIAADTVPCDSILPIVINTCDSVIVADSSLIMSLKDVIRVDSLIISSQGQVIVADSVKIASLNKEIKKHKRHKKWLIGALVVTAVLAIVK